MHIHHINQRFSDWISVCNVQIVRFDLHKRCELRSVYLPEQGWCVSVERTH